MTAMTGTLLAMVMTGTLLAMAMVVRRRGAVHSGLADRKKMGAGISSSSCVAVVAVVVVVA